MRLSRQAKSQLEEIREGIRCSADDVGIARHFHVPTYEVQAIRLEMNAPRDEEEFSRREPQEKVGSAELRDASLKLFAKFERKHKLKRGEGEILLLNTGVRMLAKHRNEELALLAEVEREAIVPERYSER